jgi:hypothetical protein
VDALKENGKYEIKSNSNETPRSDLAAITCCHVIPWKLAAMQIGRAATHTPVRH